MSNGLLENEFIDVSSTYCLLTAERILGHFAIHLSVDVLKKVLKDPGSVYYQILLGPFKNIINGIVLQQAYDYQLYVQKLFIDYYVSGSGNEKQSTMTSVGQDMERNRERLIQICDFFDKDYVAHKRLIAETQIRLIDLVADMRPIKDNAEQANLVKETMATFYVRAEDIGQAIRNYRLEFRTLIIETTQLLSLVSDYRIDEQQDLTNREDLLFNDEL